MMLTKRATGLGLIAPIIARPVDGVNWLPFTQNNPLLYGEQSNGGASWAGSLRRVGQTSTDASGNTYKWNGSSWQLVSTSGTPTTPSGIPVSLFGNQFFSATPTLPGAVALPPASPTQSPFPANPVPGQTYTDASGNVWTYTSTGWAQGASPTATSTSTAAPSWFTDPTQELISGVPNWGLVAGAGVLALLLMRGGRR